LWQYRWQIYVDFRKELLEQNRQTFGRVLWIVALPVIPLSVYLFLGLLRVFPSRPDIDGVAYVMVGATLWYLFAGLVTGSINSLNSKGRMAVRDSYPLAAIMAANHLQQVFEFILRALATAGILAIVQTPNTIGTLLAVPALVPPMLLWIGVGTISGVFSVAV